MKQNTHISFDIPNIPLRKEEKITYHYTIQCLCRAVVDIDTGHTALSTSVEIKEPQRLVHEVWCNRDRLDGDVASIPSVTEPRVESVLSGSEVQENAWVGKAGLCGGMVALGDCMGVVEVSVGLGGMKRGKTHS